MKLFVIAFVCLIMVVCLFSNIYNEGFESTKMRETDYLKRIITHINSSKYSPRIKNQKYNGIVSRIITSRIKYNGIDSQIITSDYYVVLYDASNTSELYVSRDRFLNDASSIRVGGQYDILQNYEMPSSLDSLKQMTTENKTDIVKVANILRCIPDYDAKTRQYQTGSMDDEYFKTIDPILQIIGMGKDVIGQDVSDIAINLWKMERTPEEAIYELSKKYKKEMRERPISKYDKYNIYQYVRRIYETKEMTGPDKKTAYDKLWKMDISGVSEILARYTQTEFIKNEADNLEFPEYHESAEELKKKNLPVYVKDATGQLVAQEWDDATYTSPLYDIHRKTSNFVPNYSDAIYLSSRA